jgi:cyclomaltodextrinase / maltogenic alpha-amylase / neopullulanase
MGAPDWLADAVFYQIFPERFANGDPALDPPDVEKWGGTPTRENFFGGDLAGITEHLDHIVSLGANAIYLTPVFEADTNHRYDAKDYFSIDHRLGDQAAFDRFVEAAHDRGVRIVLDAVLNHCGDGHWAFRDVVEHERRSRYVNWFSVEGFPVVAHPEPNYRTCSGCYYLPKWNAYNPEVRDHHHAVARHWIEKGIDGWRLDVPYFINQQFWRGFHDVVKGIDEDLYVVAEEWRDPEEWLTGDLADGTMNYTLRDLVLGFTADRTVDAHAFAAGMNRLDDRIPVGFHHGMLNLLGSHDTERVLTRHGEDERATRLAHDLLFCSRGAPMVYYGDEVGLVGDNDPGCRGTMPWDESEWRTAILDRVRALGRLRAELAPLRRGAQRVLAADGDTVVMVRELAGQAAGDDTVVAVVHRGGGTTVPAATLPAGGAWRVVDGDGHLDRDGDLAIGAASTVVLAGRGQGS